MVMKTEKFYAGRGFGRLYLILVLALTFGGALGWQMSSPMCSDDYVYSLAPTYGEYTEDGFWGSEGEEYSTASEVWRGISGHARVSNARLTNLIYIPVQLLPHGALKFICGMWVWLMFAGLIFVSLRGRERERSGLLLAGTLLFWFLFPWRDSMQSSDFIFNYPLVTVALLVWLVLYGRIERMSRGGRVAFALGTYVLALLHEGFTIPLGFYVFADMLLAGRKLRLYRAALWAILVAGVVTMVAMGTRERMWGLDFTPGHYVQQLGWDKVKLVSSFLPGILVVGWMAGLRLFGRKVRAGAFRRNLWPLVAAIGGGALMCVALGFYSRATWGVDVFTYLALMRLAALSFPVGRGGRVWKAVALLALAGYGWWLWELVRWQEATTASRDAVVAELAPRGSYGCDVVYAPQIHADDIPFYLMDIPAPVEEVMPFNNRSFATYWTRRRAGGVLILPEELRGLASDSIAPIAGNAGARGDYPYLFLDRPYEGHLVVRNGRFTAGHNPLMRVLAAVRPKLFGGTEDTTYPFVETTEIVMADSSKRYFVLLPCGPRTARHREILSIDTIEGGR